MHEIVFGDGVEHGGKSKGTTCVVDRDVTAYMVVDRVLQFPTEQYGCRYSQLACFRPHSASKKKANRIFIRADSQRGIEHCF